MTDALPIDATLPALRAALSRAGRAVLVAPPGAGKTTRVPLALLAGAAGRIVMLEPRRLAARAAAERMAETLGEAAGGTVGYRIRGEARVSPATRIEVVTEGILTRMIQSDPALPGIGTLIFDEFHERSLHADLGLALAWQARGVLRPDLRLLVMSATLDAAPVAALLGEAPVLVAEGRAFPVGTRWLDRPLPAGARLEPAAAALVARAVGETAGGVLVFLPGEGEIRRVAAALAGRLPEDCDIRPLYGALPFAAQRAALAPAAEGRRKVVLATAIAETSLTIPGIRVVVDAGRARRARFDPASGMTRLVTERVTRAEAEQRRGRAGRVAPGHCYRLWTRGEEGALAPFPPPEIASADLAGLALELALWGSAEDLAFLTPPPAPALDAARALLRDLGAIGEDGRITAHGKLLAGLPLHPRLAHMLVVAGPAAAPLAALLEDRDILPAAGTDLAARLRAVAGAGARAGAGAGAGAGERPGGGDADDVGGGDDGAGDAGGRGRIGRIRAEAARLARLARQAAAAGRTAPDAAADGPYDLSAMAALAYPDRIGMRRDGGGGRFLLSGGRGAVVDAADPLARAPFIVATDLDGDPREARVRVGIAIAEATLRRLFAGRIRTADTVAWSPREGRVVARRQERLMALILSDQPLARPDPAAVAQAALDGLRALGLPWSEAAGRLRARVAALRAQGVAMPDLSDAALLAEPDWLLPALAGRRSAAELRALDLAPLLRGLLGPDQARLLDRLAPAAFETPLGRAVPIDYTAEGPEVAVRLQEMFGLTRHPVIGPARQPLRITLLSPAGRPVAVTTDLPGFWAGGYAGVRRDLRGRYPRHPWPEDPAAAAPTLRAKPRG